MSSGVQLSGNEMLNKKVLSSRHCWSCTCLLSTRYARSSINQ